MFLFLITFTQKDKNVCFGIVILWTVALCGKKWLT